jgi:NSS family neurotransmitter:Na+ symporter
MEARHQFGSRLGVILASVGSAVGLGNVWRFPMEAGRSGGAAFILVYVIFVLILALPVMCSEFVVGRMGRANAADSFKRLASNGFWSVVGYMGVLAGFLILSFYVVVAAWTLYYTVESFRGSLLAEHDFSRFYSDFSTDTWHPLLYVFLFLAANTVIIAGGVQKGIERCSKWMMPLLFLIIAVLACFSLSLPGASDGVRFLLYPDLSKLTIGVVLSAMGQAFFSLSVGIGCLATYASYFKKDVDLIRSSFMICFLDTCVAVLSGVVIFPVVFSIGADVDAGPGLVFITLPHIFNTVLGASPVANYLFSALFYILLLVAALTSSVSMHEMVTALVHEKCHMTRPQASVVVAVAAMLCATACSLSFGAWQDVTVFGMGFFALFDFVTAKFMMPIGGLCFCVFVSWVMRRSVVESELCGGRFSRTRRVIVSVVYFFMRVVAPLCLLGVFFYELFGHK